MTMKRSNSGSVANGWIRCVKSKQPDTLEPEQTLVWVVFGPRTRVAVPHWIALRSGLMDHFNNQDSYPLMRQCASIDEQGVRDCVRLYEDIQRSKLLSDNTKTRRMWDAEDPYWSYRTGSRARILHSLYRWRRRLGTLLATAGYFGWSDILDVVDCVMRQRVRSSWSAKLQCILFTHGDADFKEKQLLDFFGQKLSYKRVHIEMFTSWFTNTTLNEWFCKYMFSNPRRAELAYPVLRSSLRFVFRPHSQQVPRHNYNMFLVSGFLQVQTIHEFDQHCRIFRLLSHDGVPVVTTSKLSFVNAYHLFRVAWQLPQLDFDELLLNLRVHSKTTMKLVSEGSVLTQYYQGMFNQSRPIQFTPSSHIRERWLQLLDTLSDDPCCEMLDTILRYFPNHVKYCLNPIVW